DPFTPAAEIHGAMYQFGIGTEALSQADNLSNSGAVPGWNSPVSGNGEWNMVTQNPCLPGWRVPTEDDWQGVIDNNTIYYTADGGTSWSTSAPTWSNGEEDNGIKFGDALVLPAAGVRNSGNGSLAARGVQGYYWSSTNIGSSGRVLYFSNGFYSTTLLNPARSYGYSVRCVAE
ncbi:MAG: fibrobacter succinogenes major paralogous domain-containing protein, partial [Prevotellaceae bacterium]|nr:fibrobacter succinogenes major paralogous domain-containing protein [Prevotellaceae bacterium]